MHIDVTQDDIDNGIERNPYQCPVARACRRTMPGYQFSVDRDEIQGWYGSRVTGPLWLTPESVADFTYRFDRGRFVMPFGFDLEDIP